MLTFLKNIRKSLIGSSSVRKYLIYALGEIALVVIGILIALQINNWNEQRKINTLESQYLTQLRENLISNYNDLKRDYGYLQKGLTSHYRILDYLNSQSSYQDTMCFDFYWICQDQYIFQKILIN